MVIAYLRVSTSKQHLVNQQDEIRRFAHTKEIEVSRWVTEIVSGKKNQKERKLGRVINQLKPGDTLIVTEISRLSRTLIVDIMVSRNDHYLDTSFFHLLQLFHQLFMAFFFPI